MTTSNPPEHPPEQAWTSAESQAFDQHLQASGIPAASLMEQAARSLSDFLMGVAPKGISSTVLFLCGPGNNGADAIAAARQLLLHPQLTPLILLPGGVPAPNSLLELQHEAYLALGGTELPPSTFTLESLQPQPAILVDGLFGVGLKRPIVAPYAQILTQAQQSGIPTLAVDCPSGLNCDDGRTAGPSLPATWTLSFIGAKRGFTRNAGPELCGQVHVADIGVRAELALQWLTKRRKGQGQA